jgi:uncharacterized Zn-binding protein involved in type VI secretion
MSVTVIVNFMTVSHGGSMGTSIAFPDVCKTPAPPAPPIPIPYPNVAQSKDVSSGSSTVKMDGKSIMVKGANMMVSTGDEAGSLFGVVSNKVKGKAEFVNYSFDVKVDGKNVCRLADPTQQNMGSANIMGMAHVQAPLAVLPRTAKGCEAVKKKQKKQDVDKKTAWKKSGIYKGHRSAIQQVATELSLIIFFRATNPWCTDNGWIPGKHKPKPHEVLEAKTIDRRTSVAVQRWISDETKKLGGPLWKGPPLLPPGPTALYGVVASLESHNTGEPLRGYGRDSNKYSYRGKWITGDYDLQDIMYASSDCVRPDQDAAREFGRIKKALNKGMGWDGIQHGPQAQWRQRKTKEKHSVNMPKVLKAWLQAPARTPVPKVPITEKRELSVCDANLTVVAPKGKVLHLESHEDAKNALICCGCAE